MDYYVKVRSTTKIVCQNGYINCVIQISAFPRNIEKEEKIKKADAIKFGF